MHNSTHICGWFTSFTTYIHTYIQIYTYIRSFTSCTSRLSKVPSNRAMSSWTSKACISSALCMLRTGEIYVCVCVRAYVVCIWDCLYVCVHVCKDCKNVYVFVYTYLCTHLAHWCNKYTKTSLMQVPLHYKPSLTKADLKQNKHT
jgi:hypothetical protein